MKTGLGTEDHGPPHLWAMRLLALSLAALAVRTRSRVAVLAKAWMLRF